MSVAVCLSLVVSWREFFGGVSCVYRCLCLLFVGVVSCVCLVSVVAMFMCWSLFVVVVWFVGSVVVARRSMFCERPA